MTALALQILDECRAGTGRHLLPLRGPEPGIEDRWRACELLVKQGQARWFEKDKTPYWPGDRTSEGAMNTAERYPALSNLAVLVAGENAISLAEREVIAELGKVIEAEPDSADAVETWLSLLSVDDVQAIAEVDEQAMDRLIVTAPENTDFFLTGVFNIGVTNPTM